MILFIVPFVVDNVNHSVYLVVFVNIIEFVILRVNQVAIFGNDICSFIYGRSKYHIVPARFVFFNIDAAFFISLLIRLFVFAVVSAVVVLVVVIVVVAVPPIAAFTGIASVGVFRFDIFILYSFAVGSVLDNGIYSVDYIVKFVKNNVLICGMCVIISTAEINSGNTKCGGYI